MHGMLACALLLCLVLLAMWCPPVHAAPAAVPPSKPFAMLWQLAGELSAAGTECRRLLQLGDTVMVGERLSAVATSEAVLQTRDAGLIAIRPGAEFLALQFVAEGKPTDINRLKLFKGALRLITG